MPPRIALIVFLGFIGWLFVRDLKRRSLVSSAIYIPLLWMVILGSRPVSIWFGGGVSMQSTDDYLEGSPFDRMVFLFLILAGAVVLLRRRVNWKALAANNKWFLAFTLFWGLSVLWSDYSMVAFKRWIKDLGHIVMVLIIFTEKDPVEATKALFSRCAYVLVLLSVLFIKYFPDLGRFYNRWTWEMMYTGITLEKNALGNTALICGLFLFWEWLDLWDRKGKRLLQIDLANYSLLLLMVVWLLIMAHSSTSIACAILGAGLLLAVRLQVVKANLKRLELYGCAAALLFVVLQGLFDIKAAVVEGLGRDMTLTGRTDLWKELVHANINPLLGEGFYTFWLTDVANAICENYYWHPNQAHNGYLDTYLNGGLLGFGLLCGLLVVTARHVKKDLMRGTGLGALGLAILLVSITCNWTEAIFNKMSLGWFALVLVIVNYPTVTARRIATQAQGSRLKGDTSEPRSPQFVELDATRPGSSFAR